MSIFGNPKKDNWIPAFAGMTGKMHWIFCKGLRPRQRHSREGGNPVLLACFLFFCVITASTGNRHGGSVDTYIDPHTGDTVHSVIAPRQPQTHTQNTPIIVYPLVRPDISGPTGPIGPTGPPPSRPVPPAYPPTKAPPITVR